MSLPRLATIETLDRAWQPARTTPLQERLWRRVGVAATGCWEWVGCVRSGYGAIKDNGKSLRVHRLAYELLVGPIPDDRVLDHLCRNRRCVNPDHLEVVTSAENTWRGESPSAHNRRKTHCWKGHPLSGANLRVRFNETHPNGHRICLTCYAERNRRGGLDERDA